MGIVGSVGRFDRVGQRRPDQRDHVGLGILGRLGRLQPVGDFGLLGRFGFVGGLVPGGVKFCRSP